MVHILFPTRDFFCVNIQWPDPTSFQAFFLKPVEFSVYYFRRMKISEPNLEQWMSVMGHNLQSSILPFFCIGFIVSNPQMPWTFCSWMGNSLDHVLFYFSRIRFHWYNLLHVRCVFCLLSTIPFYKRFV